jgi:hypothetical protein
MGERDRIVKSMMNPAVASKGRHIPILTAQTYRERRNSIRSTMRWEKKILTFLIQVAVTPAVVTRALTIRAMATCPIRIVVVR